MSNEKAKCEICGKIMKENKNPNWKMLCKECITEDNIFNELKKEGIMWYKKR